jgi:Ca-activated chloride channel family protein
MSRLQVAAVGLLVCALLAVAASGQSGALVTPPQAVAVIEGTVLDTGKGLIPGAQVTLEQDTKVIATTITNASGQFRFDKVQPGKYTVKAALSGFKTTVTTLAAAAGQVHRLALTLEIGAMGETVTVQERTEILQAQTAASRISALPQSMVNVTLDGVSAVGAAGRGGASDQFFARYQPITANDESYARIETNRFNLTTAEPLSTFAADVDSASYTNVRRFLNEGKLPPIDAVRVEELINYFRFQYREPQGDRPVSVTTEVGAAPWEPNHKLVLVGVRAKAIDQDSVGGRNIVLLIDVSGSMMPANKLPLVKTGLRMFVDTLRDDDRIAIVVYAGASGLCLPSTPARHRQRIHDAIESLHAGGSTNGGEGLKLAYRVAQEHFVRGGINRVILATDGDFNVGVTGQSELLNLIEEKKRTGIFLSVLGVGTGNLKDSTMEMLADKGNGHYAYLDSLHEARRVLVREGGATLETVAKDVKFQIEFNPAMVAAWRLIGYENRLLAHQDFNNDLKDGGELGAGHTVTVLYEIVPAGVNLPAELSRDEGERPAIDPLIYQTARQQSNGSRNQDLLTVKIRYKAPDGDRSSLITQPVRAGGSTRDLPFAAAVAEFGMLLRTPEAPADRWMRLTRNLKSMDVPIEDAADVQGFRELVELAAGLKKLK